MKKMNLYIQEIHQIPSMMKTNRLICRLLILKILSTKKKDVQLESCDLSFIWCKMRTAAREAASQIALRDCSKAAMRESHYISFGEG